MSRPITLICAEVPFDKLPQYTSSVTDLDKQRRLSTDTYRPTPIGRRLSADTVTDLDKQRRLSTDTYRSTLIGFRGYLVNLINNLGTLLEPKANLINNLGPLLEPKADLIKVYRDLRAPSFARDSRSYPN